MIKVIFDYSIKKVLNSIYQVGDCNVGNYIQANISLDGNFVLGWLLGVVG